MSMTHPSRDAYSVDEVAERAGVGRDAVYDAIREKRLVARKWGKRTVITQTAFRAFLESLPELTLDPPPVGTTTKSDRSRSAIGPSNQKPAEIPSPVKVSPGVRKLVPMRGGSPDIRRRTSNVSITA